MKLRYLLAFIAVVLVFGLVGQMDYEDEVAEASHYDEMVCSGYWPDYERRKPDCEGVKVWKKTGSQSL